MAQSDSKSINKEVRPLANFPPSIWGNYFDSFSLNYKEKEVDAKKVDALKGEVKEILTASKSSPMDNIKLIDLLSHLGVSYHFEKEIEEQLEQQFKSYKLIIIEMADDLDSIAVFFRVFRQNGYYISSDVFSKFTDNNGKFKEELTLNLRGMLSLYEATHLRIHGEDILDEALEFTTMYLKPLATQSSHPLAKQILHCLDYPIQKCIPRVEARNFINIYGQDEDHNDLLLEFANRDFNFVQTLHREELSHISKWHRELASKLTYARDRAIELYFWIMTVYYEPHFSRARIIATKILIIYSFLDDTYDAYGTPAELNKFTDEIKRWKIDVVEELPHYMKILYEAMLNLFEELDQEISKEGRSDIVNYVKQLTIELACAYNQEVKWHKKNYVPKFDKYMSNARETSGARALVAASLIGMREIVGKEAIEWLNSDPEIIKATETSGRLLNDIQSHKIEQERGHCVSAMECYMNEHGVEEDEAIKALNKILDNIWKDINEECMKPSGISMKVLSRALGFCRSNILIYKNTDGYTNAEALKETIMNLYVNKVSI